MALRIFFADSSFSRFLKNRMRHCEGRSAVLIINGDFIDFLRIKNVPDSDHDFEQWASALSKVGIKKTESELRAAVDDHERLYGLRTDEFKSVWKLLMCIKGHPEFFNILKEWITVGNELTVIKGNHDLEWHWPAVQEYIKLELVTGDERVKSHDAIRFVQDVLLINKIIHLEHGHRYEKLTWATGSPVLDGGKELRLSAGSFLNRYLLNRIELSFPYVDNIRPQSMVLSTLIREHFPLALKIFFWYFPGAVTKIPIREIKHVLPFSGKFYWVLGLAAVLILYWMIDFFQSLTFTVGDFHHLLHLLKNLGLVILAGYCLIRILSWIKLTPDTSFYGRAKDIFKSHPHIQLVSFGHTHDPEQKEQKEQNGKVYYNTGTWMPVYQISAADVRLDLAYTFLFMTIGSKGELTDRGLLRWNDDAGRTEPVVLMERKSESGD